MHNLKFDQPLASFVHDAGGGAVTAIAFRAGAAAPLMAAGGQSGTVTVWDLEKGKLHSVLEDAHDNAVSARTYNIPSVEHHVPFRPNAVSLLRWGGRLARQ